MNKPEKLILDYSKWRCGGFGLYQLGDGFTKLLNAQGFSCCLGQFSKQLGANNSDLSHSNFPYQLKFKIPLFADEGPWNTSLARDCININDNIDTSPEEKIQLLTTRLQEEGIQLEVINKP